MEIVYYYDSALKCCPVKSYLLRYLKDNKGKRLLANIDQKICYIAENGGRITTGFSSKLYEYEGFEIKERKDKNTLIRIVYFIYENKMVLLHALEKPESYKTTKQRKDIEKQFKIAQKYINKFKQYKNYEKYI